MAWPWGGVFTIAESLGGQVYRDGELYTIEFGETPASEIAEVLYGLGAEQGSREILLGVESFALDPETGESTEPEWRMLVPRSPAIYSLRQGGENLAQWAELAMGRSRLLVIARAITVRTYPR